MSAARWKERMRKGEMNGEKHLDGQKRGQSDRDVGKRERDILERLSDKRRNDK